MLVRLPISLGADYHCAPHTPNFWYFWGYCPADRQIIRYLLSELRPDSGEQLNGLNGNTRVPARASRSNRERRENKRIFAMLHSHTQATFRSTYWRTQLHGKVETENDESAAVANSLRRPNELHVRSERQSRCQSKAIGFSDSGAQAERNA
jgi:hypothetical protein